MIVLDISIDRLYGKGRFLSTTHVHPNMDTAQPPHPRAVPIRSRYLYIGLAALFLLGVFAQVFLAGAALFDRSAWFTWHNTLGHLLVHPLPLIPLLLLILSFVGRLPRADKWLSALLLVLAILQPMLIYVGRGASLPLLAALHPVNALLLFVLPMFLIARVRRSMRMRQLDAVAA
jgi:hypothetical protein